MTLKAIIHVAEEGGYWAEVPALPGCVRQGETVEGWLSAEAVEFRLGLVAGGSADLSSRQDIGLVRLQPRRPGPR
ncbi:MAG: type II toxin-antitoxin system HicB family antitoxin [Verrucomicrobia bacterium]|nr:type II toxin-antitoxin system HicB family antitoxin [Verrucomicrobiota bacterium]